MDLYYKEIHGQDPAVAQLYQSAFPATERVPFMDLLKWPGSQLIGVYTDPEHKTLGGMVDLLEYKGVCQLRYLAISDSLRSHGLGSKILQWLKKTKTDSVIAIDVESDEVPCDNLEQRKRRLSFYQHNGFDESEDSYRWNGEVFKILVANGQMKKGTYVHLWQELFDKAKK